VFRSGALRWGKLRAMPVAIELIYTRSTHFADIRFDLSRAPRLGNNHPFARFQKPRQARLRWACGFDAVIKR
jgi:hypothetical protein